MLAVERRKSLLEWPQTEQPQLGCACPDDAPTGPPSRLASDLCWSAVWSVRERSGPEQISQGDRDRLGRVSHRMETQQMWRSCHWNDRAHTDCKMPVVAHHIQKIVEKATGGLLMFVVVHA
jgi:hypothetical protein